MENTNAEVINSQDLIKNIFQEYSPTPAEEAKPVIENKEEVKIEQPVVSQKQEEATPPVQEAVKVFTDYSKKLKSLITEGFIENVAINYNDEEAYLEDISDLDEDSYNAIIKSYREEKEKELKSKYISTEKFDDQTKKLLEIKQAGGNISDIIRENVTAIEQIQQLKDNIDNENVQVNIVGKDLEQRGLDIELIRSQIQTLISRGELETKATEILESHLSIHNDAIEKKRMEELQRVEAEKESLKNQRKELTSIYKEYKLPESMQKILVDNATKLDNDKISNTDKLYFEAIKDPKKLAEINFFLNNPEEFKKFISSKQVLETKLDSVKKHFSISINNTKKPKVTANTLEEYAGNIINKHNTN